MGSSTEWGHVLTDAVYSGGFLLLLLWGLGRIDEDTPRQRLLILIGVFYFGVAYGLFHTFDSRLWHWPLSVVSTIVALSYVVVAFVFRQQVAANWTRDWKVWGLRLRRLFPRPR